MRVLSSVLGTILRVKEYYPILQVRKSRSRKVKGLFKEHTACINDRDLNLDLFNCEGCFWVLGVVGWGRGTGEL